MKVKIKNVIIDTEYDCIVVDIDNRETQVVFDKSTNVAKYNGKYIDLENKNGIFYISEISNTKK